MVSEFMMCGYMVRLSRRSRWTRACVRRSDCGDGKVPPCHRILQQHGYA